MPILRARCTDDFRDAVDAYCARTGRREGELIRAALGHILGRADASGADSEEDGPAQEYEKAEASINVSVTPSEKRAIADRAKAEGMRPGRWLVWLARHHLTRQRHFNPAELDALREATRQLAAVGSNLNQVAHALNVDYSHRDQLTDDLIREVADQVKQLRRTIKGYIEVSINRWGI